MQATRNLVLVLGDQLSKESSAFDGFDRQKDRVWMAENAYESTYVWSHKARLVLFFSAMRHFKDDLLKNKYRVAYHALQADGRRDSGHDFTTLLAISLREYKPEKIIVLQPGDWRVQDTLQRCAQEFNTPLEIRNDRDFYCDTDAFAEWAQDRNRWVLEDFYREMRRQHGILMHNSEPEGGQWNLDADNREAFGKNGPGTIPERPAFPPDTLTQAVIDMVETRFSDHPGSLTSFNLPVTQDQAAQALEHFITYCLADFGRWQDAIWQGQHLLYHSQLAASLNLHLLTPRQCVHAAEAAYESGVAPLNSVEGFVRQILGWREFVRGVYWQTMPGYQDKNALQARLPVPDFFWHGETDMACVADAMQGLIQHAYAHHIVRLMVLGLFALVAGVNPRQFHDWHMAMYTDAIDWVSLPNALGMSQFGDGGLLATKPYCASGNYINKMSNHCSGCRYNYRKAHGEDACPFTTLYWDFLDRNSQRLSKNHRMNFQMKNLEKKHQDAATMQAIRHQATVLKQALQNKERF